MSSPTFFARLRANGRILPGSAQEVPMGDHVFNTLNMRSINALLFTIWNGYSIL